MKLKTLRLKPFAAHTDFAIDFDAGLNVILGENEAGKSTIIDALKTALFQDTGSGKRIQQKIQPYIPAGGDTARITLAYDINGETFELQKSWGGSNESRMRLPGGTLLTDDTAVQEKLSQHLALNEATYLNVLFTSQTSLPRPQRELGAGTDVHHDLKNLLRRSLFESDGVSVDRLGILLEDRLAKYFSRWDKAANRPERDRDYDNPWTRDVGLILKTYYDLRQKDSELRDVLETEETLGGLSAEVAELQSTIRRLDSFLRDNKQRVDGARDIQIAQRDLDKLEQRAAQLAEIHDAWLKYEPGVKTARERGAELTKRIEQLQSQRQQSEFIQENKPRIARLSDAREADCKRLEGEQQLEEIAPITAEDAAKLRGYERLIQEADVKLLAAKLRLSMEAKRRLTVEVTDGRMHETWTFSAGEARKTTGAARLRVQHEDWTLQVEPADLDVDALTGELADLRSQRAELLQVLGFTEVQEALLVRARREELVRIATAQSDAIEHMLGDTPLAELEELEGVLRELGDLPSPAELAESIAELQHEQKQLTDEIADMQRALDEWTRDYSSRQDLFLKAGEAAVDARNQREKIAKLGGALPEDLDINELIEEYRKMEAERNEKREHVNSLEVDRARLETMAESIGKTTRELQAEHEEARSAFERAKEEGAALERIYAVYRSVKEDLDSSTLDGWLDDLSKSFQQLTEGRYTTISLEGEQQVKRTDGVELPVTRISTSTKTTLALALRLTMARHFLNGRQGFVILDDPLVDLDKQRRQAASGLINRFAQEKQVIVMTCHDDHAKVLGGALKEVPRLELQAEVGAPSAPV